MTISEIASALGFADSTVFQFTRKLGYKGFRDFRNDLLTEEFDPEISIHENIKQGDNHLSMAQKVFDSSIQSLQNTCSLLNNENLEKAAKIIASSNRLSFFGVAAPMLSHMMPITSSCVLPFPVSMELIFTSS